MKKGVFLYTFCLHGVLILNLQFLNSYILLIFYSVPLFFFFFLRTGKDEHYELLGSPCVYVFFVMMLSTW